MVDQRVAQPGGGGEDDAAEPRERQPPHRAVLGAFGAEEKVGGKNAKSKDVQDRVEGGRPADLYVWD